MSRNFCDKGSQLILITWCSVFFISVLLTKPVLMHVDEPAKELYTACNEDYVNKSGKCILPKNHQDFKIYLNFEKDSSIIHLTAKIQFNENYTIENVTGEIAGFSITVCEFTKDVDDNGIAFSWEECDEDTYNITTNFSYLTKTSNATVLVSCTGDCFYYDVIFSFEEIENRLNVYYHKEAESWAMIKYSPNSVNLLYLNDSDKRWTGVEISFKNIRINSIMGEYLLIGTGTDPLGEDARTHFITQVPNDTTYYVDNPSAYVAFVSGPVRKEDEGFTIQWNFISADKPDEDKGGSIGYWNTYLICFSNDSTNGTKGRLMEDCENSFENFRTIFVETAQRITNQTYKLEEIKLTGGDCSQADEPFLLQVVHGGKYISRRELQRITEEMKSDLSYDVHRCDHSIVNPQKAESSFWMYALVPIFALFGLMMWAWKQNVFAQKCRTEKERKISKESISQIKVTMNQMPSQPNMYERTAPKLRWTDEQVRTDPLLPSSSQDNRRDNEERTAIEFSATSSDEPDKLTSFFKSGRSKQRPSLELLKIAIEENNKTSVAKVEGNEGEHYYDSVSTEDRKKETKL